MPNKNPLSFEDVANINTNEKPSDKNKEIRSYMAIIEAIAVDSDMYETDPDYEKNVKLRIEGIKKAIQEIENIISDELS
ncbi:hypothetical protein [Chengkuizengella sediminis]|uniref:hypothetical protein n=1 Tax=Chengkuizengella sediminis TaxID=1885917 RepID=UPI00138A1C50|nr:hypothetical protein [Chengkuizengella sediminis]NDI34684.1 hypothetical protein [Chengkuizengella sediminis]